MRGESVIIEKGYSLLTVMYKNNDEILQLLQSVKNHLMDSYSIELIIVDNGSSFPYQKEQKKGKLRILTVSMGENLGYGRAINLGLNYARYKNILVVNPDIRFKDSCFFEFISRLPMEYKNNAIYTCLLLNEDGTPQRSFRRFPTIKYILGKFFYEDLGLKLGVFRKLRDIYLYYDYDINDSELISVDWFSGAFFYINYDLIRKYLNGKIFDERYFMYFEDVYLCLNLHSKGVERYVVTSCSVEHKGHYASRRIFSKAFWHHLLSLLKYMIDKDKIL